MRRLLLIAILLILILLSIKQAGAQWPCKGSYTPGSGEWYCASNDFRLSVSTRVIEPDFVGLMVCDHIGYFAQREQDVYTLVFWVDPETREIISPLPNIAFSPSLRYPCEGYALEQSPPIPGAVPDVLVAHGRAYIPLGVYHGD